MDAEQIQALIDAGFANANSSSSAVLIFMGAFMGMVTVIISLSLVFVVVRLLGVQTLFINAMTVRSVTAIEQGSLKTDVQTQAIQGQSNVMEAMNRTGLATAAAVSAVSDKFSIGLEILKLLGVDVGELAKHASNPTAASKDKVDEIAGKAEQTGPGQPPPPQQGDEIPVTGEVTGVVKLTTTTDTPAVPT